MVPKTTTTILLVDSQVINNVKNASKIYYHGLEIMYIKLLNLCFRGKTFSLLAKKILELNMKTILS